jgi:Toastrack DUF4097
MAEHTFHTPLPPRLDVSIPAGDIEIETVDGEESTIVVEGDERAVEDTRVSHDGDRIVVEYRSRKPFGLTVQIGNFSWGHDGLRVRARVPHGAAARMKTASADMQVSGRLEELEVNSTSGDLEARGEVARDVTVKTVSGDARLDRVGGSLSVQSVSGDVRVEQVGGSVDTKSVSGDIRLGSVTAGDARFSSVSGDIEIGIAAGSLLDVDAGSSSGDLSSAVPLASAPPQGGDDPGPTVVLRGRTVSGDVRVFRAG